MVFAFVRVALNIAGFWAFVAFVAYVSRSLRSKRGNAVRNARASPQPLADGDDDDDGGQVDGNGGSQSRSSSPPRQKWRPYYVGGWRIEHSFGHLRVRTDAYNALFAELAALAPRAWGAWFAAGAVYGVLALLSSIGVILAACAKWVEREWGADAHFLPPERRMGAGGGDIWEAGERVSDWLVPVIPGINLPLEHYGYYFASLMLAAVVHESGHAIAAAVKRVPVFASGAFLYYIYPGAFVELSEGAVRALPPFARLQIVAAGIWHNAALASAAALALYSLPLWASPLYRELPSGALVLSVAAGSPTGAALARGSVVESVNGVAVAHSGAFAAAVLAANNTAAYRLPLDLLAVSNSGCCTSPRDAELSEAGRETCFEPVAGNASAVCLGLAQTLRVASLCTTADVSAGCFAPRVPAGAGGGSLFHLRVRPPRAADPALVRDLAFFASPAALVRAVQVGRLQPRVALVPLLLPARVETFLQYLVSLSLTLSILNMVPAVYTDGHEALRAVADMLGLGHHRKTLSGIVYACTGLMAAVTLLSVASLAVNIR